MKKLFYVFLIIWLINIIIHGLLTFFNLAIFGVFLGIMAEKQKRGTYSLWKLIVGIGIASCSILITVGMILQRVK